MLVILMKLDGHVFGCRRKKSILSEYWRIHGIHIVAGFHCTNNDMRQNKKHLFIFHVLIQQSNFAESIQNYTMSMKNLLEIMFTL